MSGLTPVTATRPSALTAALPDVAEADQVKVESKFEIVAVSPLVEVATLAISGISAALSEVPEAYAVPSE